MSREIRVGLMFTLSLGVLAVALYFLGSFQEMVSYRIKFSKVNGLAPDSPVQFNGVPIGRVSQIVLSEDPPVEGQVPIIVTIAVHRSARQHIRASTTADIRSIGVLGDKTILLVTDDYSAKTLEEDDFIQPSPRMLDVDKLLKQGTDMVSDISEITEDFKVVLNQLREGEGLLYTVINDEALANDLRKSIARTVAILENEENFLSLITDDPEFAQKVKTDITRLTHTAADLSERYSEADGLIPSLMEDEAYAASVRARVDHVLDRSVSYVNALTESEGLLYRLTQDEEYGDEVAENVRRATFHLANILEKIDRGDGSVGLMINDPSLYQGLYEVVYGLQHSGISKWYIQKKQRKGEELLDENDPNP